TAQRNRPRSAYPRADHALDQIHDQSVQGRNRPLSGPPACALKQLMSTLPDQSRFHDMYSAPAPAPWDIGRPQSAIGNAADLAKSPLLDSGCGTGDTAIFFASRGHKVTGIDFLEEPLR